MNRKSQVNGGDLDQIFAPYNRSDAPGLVVGVASRGRPVYRRAFGLASIELPVSLTPTMRLRIGSTTKHFLCLTILLLAEEGKLTLEDSPRRHLPELPVWAESMTLRQLMSHTSGMRCSLDLIMQLSGISRPAPEGSQLKLLTQQDSVNFAPGESWSYNNGGYVLLTTIVERLEKAPLAEVLRTRVFEPVGMNDTLLRPYDTDCVPNSASLHVPSLTGGFTRGIFGPPIGGEGGIASTVDDMLAWLAHMSNPKVGSTEAWAAMRTPLTSHGYGLGLSMGEYRGARVIHHGGSVIGGSCQMLKVVDHDLDIIIMTNRSGVIDPTVLTEQVIDACIPDLSAKPDDATEAALVTGDFYGAESGRFVRLFEQDGRQFGQVFAAKLPLVRGASGDLSLRNITTDLRLAPTAAGGQVRELELTEFGQSERLRRVEPPAEPAPMAAGRYICPSCDAVAEVSGAGEGQGLQISGAYGSIAYGLESVGPGLFLASTGNPLLPLGGLIEVETGGFAFSSVRTRRLRFNHAA